ncbi:MULTISPECIES: fasciclin domain-containing protein [Flavobacteriaceae]|uniref:Fasciclin domain-containing protein n=2 Tax=Flavobacteriaceae TaxID=49546 RepID=A0A4Y8ASL2_9FLAO|nr:MULTISPECIES: fasciclin domain-containing protein [Flavobacteriaceae]TEW74869.1 fasciclin domain-containing protein [Gramella jeungdoensis]GGK43343.1 fasciclin [Lutibacter litoralis]
MKTKQTNQLFISFFTLILVLLVSCGEAEKKGQAAETNSTEIEEAQGQSTVVDEESAANALQVAKSLPDFSTLVAAIDAAGVDDALVNVGPLTVFAPLNSAFAKLPEGTVETLVKPENKEQLAFILKNHVAPANYPDTQLKKEAKKGRKLYMASGKYLVVENREDGLYVGGTKVLKTVQVSNGWIHVIDDVLVPAE